MSTNQTEVNPQQLNWRVSDIERKLFFSGGRFTKASHILSALLALACTTMFYGILEIPQARSSYVYEVFTQRGPTQYLTVFFFSWCVCLLVIKRQKLALQRKVLDLKIVPREMGFVLSPESASVVLRHVDELVDDPKHFLVLNRVVVALSNLKNLKRVGDVDDILRSQAQQDEAGIETSYALLQGFVWAIPVLGFIGTVLGLSEAIGQFGGVLGNSDDLSQISSSLKNVTAGLATAFDTTLVALIAALVVQLSITFMRKEEEEFLDDAMEFGLRNIVNRLRLTDDGLGAS
jgi:biopolymer transport protein ExbB/TolQ